MDKDLRPDLRSEHSGRPRDSGHIVRFGRRNPPQKAPDTGVPVGNCSPSTPTWTNCRKGINGGEKGIRTLETVPRLHTFQACAFDHSAISPHRLIPGLESPERPAVRPARARRNILIGGFGARDHVKEMTIVFHRGAPHLVGRPACMAKESCAREERVSQPHLIPVQHRECGCGLFCELPAPG